MRDIVFIRKYASSRSGGSATVKVFSKEDFINDNFNRPSSWRSSRHDIQFCFLGDNSEAICKMTLEIFEEIFTKAEIQEIQENGLLDYNSNGYNTDRKYPLFKKEIYIKYGIDLCQ